TLCCLVASIESACRAKTILECEMFGKDLGLRLHKRVRRSARSPRKPQPENRQMVETLQFVMLYPPEGNSSVLEVGNDDLGEFLRVSLLKNGDLNFEFLVEPAPLISEKHLQEIIAT